jgi:TonB family protein
MNRLQKKCVLATTGFHLLLLVILFVGPAFFTAREKEDDAPVLDLIPASTVDAANRGVRSAQPPPPAPVAPPEPIAQPSKPEPRVVTPPKPAPVPAPEKVEPVKPPKETVKPNVEPVKKSDPVRPHTPQVNLNLTERTVPKHVLTPSRPAPDNAQAVNSALEALRDHLSSPTEVAPVGNSSAAAANYAQVVKSIYERAWTPPADTASDDANIKVRVTIASDGTVISASVIEPSGDASVDMSVRHTLDRVQFIAPFPSGTTDKERTYIINFNLKAKRMLG